MSVLELRDAKLRLITTHYRETEDGDYEVLATEMSKYYACRLQRNAELRAGGRLKAVWNYKAGGENISYTHKIFLDEMPDGLKEGSLVELTWRDGRTEKLRVSGMKPGQLSNQISVSIC